jgi:hypothetical protein
MALKKRILNTVTGREQWMADTTKYQESVGTGNGSTVNFTLAHAPVSNMYLDVYVNGLRVQISLWSITTVTLTFTTAPPAGSDIYVDYWY